MFLFCKYRKEPWQLTVSDFNFQFSMFLYLFIYKKDGFLAIEGVRKILEKQIERLNFK